MRTLFLGKNKDSVLRALDMLLDRGIEVAAVVAPPVEAPGLGDVNLASHASEEGLRVLNPRMLKEALEEEPLPEYLSELDVSVSFLYPRRIRRPLLDLARLGCINFHPAPLPEYRGWGIYIFGLLNAESKWGVTAHWVDEDFDTGDLIKVRRFDVNPVHETSLSLERRSQRYLLELFEEVVDRLLRGERLPRDKQGEGTYYDRASTEKERRIRADDTPETIDRRIRAFWYPPYGGATVELAGREYVVVNETVLAEVGDRYHAAGASPETVDP